MDLKAALSRALERLRPHAPPSARVRLLLRRFLSTEIVVDEGASLRRRLHIERLMGLVRISDASPPIVQDCIVDTGAFLTIFPQSKWTRFSKHVQWLEYPGISLPDWLCRMRGTTGGSVPCRPGLIRLQLIDLENHAIPPSHVVSLFALDDGLLKQVVLGLGGGEFAGRSLEFDYDSQTAWFIETQQ